MCQTHCTYTNITSWFVCNETIHNYNTRSKNKFHYCDVKNDKTLRLVRHQGPRIWNNLTQDLMSSTYFNPFRIKLKSNLVSAYSRIQIKFGNSYFVISLKPTFMKAYSHFAYFEHIIQ